MSKQSQDTPDFDDQVKIILQSLRHFDNRKHQETFLEDVFKSIYSQAFEAVRSEVAQKLDPIAMGFEGGDTWELKLLFKDLETYNAAYEEIKALVRLRSLPPQGEEK